MPGSIARFRRRAQEDRARRRRLRSRARAMLSLGAALAVALLGLTMFLTNALRGPELGSIDRRFELRPDPPRADDVAVVAIDDKTFADLALRWPFQRRIHGQVIDRLRRAGAKVIVVDVQFTEESGPTAADIANDNALLEAVRRAPRVAMATTEVDADGSTRVFGGGAALEFSRARVGMALFPNDRNGTIRRMRHDEQRVRTLAVVAAEQAAGRSIPRRALGGDTAYIDFRGPPGTIPTYSYSDVLRGRVAADRLRGRVVVVGPSAPSLQDVHSTSTTGDDLMSGAEIQANAIWTALHGFPLQPSPGWAGALIVALMGLLAPPLFLLNARRGTAIVLAVGVAYAVAAKLLFDAGTIVPVVYPLATLGLGMVAGLAVLLVTGAFERERVRDLFARFVPESVVRDVLSKIDDDLRLGGERRIATVLFSDLRGFTSYADSCSPDQVIDVLNRYLTAMSDVILDHGGTLVAYMGDGIMAVFGAPIEQDDHADRALAAARQMSGPALDAFNAWMREAGVGDGFRMGVGLNSGVVMSGNVGSQRRLEYTAIGDTTNTAARLEGMTKGTPFVIFAGERTREMLHEAPEDLVHVDDMAIRGKQERLSVWGILDPVPFTDEELAPAPKPAPADAGAEEEPTDQPARAG